MALNRKNALFAGSDAGAENWATIASLIETCKLNAVDPLAYMTATLTAIVNSRKQSWIGELLPWNCPDGKNFCTTTLAMALGTSCGGTEVTSTSLRCEWNMACH